MNKLTDKQKLDFLIAKIQEKANETHCYDGLSVEDGESYSPGDNGNYDDAFEDGNTYGEIEFARHILDVIKVLNSD